MFKPSGHVIVRFVKVFFCNHGLRYAVLGNVVTFSTMNANQKLVDYFIISGLNISSGLEPDQLSGYFLLLFLFFILKCKK